MSQPAEVDVSVSFCVFKEILWICSRCLISPLVLELFMDVLLGHLWHCADGDDESLILEKYFHTFDFSIMKWNCKKIAFIKLTL